MTEREVVADHFAWLNEQTTPPRVRLGRSQWQVQGIKAAATLADLDEPVRMPRPGAGDVARFAGLDATWNERLASPTADLAIVGTLKWLQDDLDVFLTRAGVPVAPDVLTGFIQHAYTGGKGVRPQDSCDTIGGLLLPESKKAATWITRLYASSAVADQMPLPKDIRAVVLDGAGAIKHLAEIEAPAVTCILDRSVADETAAEIVVQLRNSRSEPLSLKDSLGWRPPAGVEALAFTVAL